MPDSGEFTKDILLDLRLRKEGAMGEEGPHR